MRWFKKSAAPVTPNIVRVDGVEQLRRFRDIGDEFNYLGVRMVVTRIHDLRMHGIHMPILHADYVDNSGCIRHAEFHLRELPALIKQNQESA